MRLLFFTWVTLHYLHEKSMHSSYILNEWRPQSSILFTTFSNLKGLETWRGTIYKDV